MHRRADAPGRTRTTRTGTHRQVAVVGALALGFASGCKRSSETSASAASSATTFAANTPSASAATFVKPPSADGAGFATARAAFATKLVRRAPAPQEFDAAPTPKGARELEYVSVGRRLRAWISDVPKDGATRPAVLFLHGGFAISAEDWEQSRLYREAGFVVMTPFLRGENGLPGEFSLFFGELDDAIAAGERLRTEPGIDAKRTFVAGHSIGGTLAMLVAMRSDAFRGAAPLSGAPDVATWAQQQPSIIPFDPTDASEFAIRSPMAWPGSFRCPTRLYFGGAEAFFAASTRDLAKRASERGRDVVAVETPGDHLGHVDGSIRKSIEFFASLK